MTRSSDPQFVAALRGIVAPNHVLDDPAVKAGYETDWTRRFSGVAAAVVRPADTEQVSRIMTVASSAAVPVVAQGGNTGLVGGGVPRGGEMLLNLSRLKRLDPVDEGAAEVTAGAGVTLAQLQAHVRSAGFDFGVDLGARDAATIGGMIATNAGGSHAWRYGSMRAQIIGMEAVMADGRIMRRLPGTAKDNTGYHLPSLLAGSEGTLAVITAARLRLFPLLQRRAAALIGVVDTNSALQVFADLRRRLMTLEAAEIFFADGLDLVLRHTGAAEPLTQRHPVYLLIECATQADATDDLVDAIAAVPGFRDAVIATDPAARARLWRLRESHPEAVGAQGVPHKLDVTLPLGRLDQFQRRLRGVVSKAHRGARVFVWGHLGDGNLHVNVLGLRPDDEVVTEAVLRLVVELGGSISAEHGIGIAKARWLELDRSPVDRQIMQEIKRALDPQGILNPGVLFSDARSRP